MQLLWTALRLQNLTGKGKSVFCPFIPHNTSGWSESISIDLSVPSYYHKHMSHLNLGLIKLCLWCVGVNVWQFTYNKEPQLSDPLLTNSLNYIQAFLMSSDFWKTKQFNTQTGINFICTQTLWLSNVIVYFWHCSDSWGSTKYGKNKSVKPINTLLDPLLHWHTLLPQS